MIERKVVSVSLTPKLHAFARGLAGTGSYGSVSEVVRASLRLLQEREADLQHRRQDRTDPPEAMEG